MMETKLHKLAREYSNDLILHDFERKPYRAGFIDGYLKALNIAMTTRPKLLPDGDKMFALGHEAGQESIITRIYNFAHQVSESVVDDAERIKALEELQKYAQENKLGVENDPT